MNSQLDKSNMAPDSFAAISRLAYQESGLQLVAEKTSMIQSRLRHRLRAVGIDTFDKYAAFVCSDDGIGERRQMISALTTNVSHFFREHHHFEMLADQIMPSLIDGVRSGSRLRIWSAGCSNGQEAFSIAMALLNKFPDLAKLDFKILATDIDPNVVNFATQAVYPKSLIGGVPSDLLKKYFRSETDNREERFSAGEELRSLVSFRELNLLSSWPMKHQFDVIFCRNVVIYFDAQTQNKLWPRFRQVLTNRGHLFLGHSERISDPQNAGFVSSGPTAYQADIKSTN